MELNLNTLEFKRLENTLFERRNNYDIMTNYKKLHNYITYIEEKHHTTGNWDLYASPLIYECAYKYHLSDKKELPMFNEYLSKLKKDISFNEFCKELEKYDEILVDPDDEKQGTIYMTLILEVAEKLLKNSWYHINYNNDEINPYNFEYSIYLAVSNQDLHDFSAKLLRKCDSLGIQYNFKINSNLWNDRRADNVTIYTSKEDFPKYILAIEEIKKENPNMNFEKSYLLSFSYNEYIGVAPVNSSEYLCKEICRIRLKRYSKFKDFFNEVQTTMLRELNDSIMLCDKTIKLISTQKDSIINSNVKTKTQQIVTTNTNININQIDTTKYQYLYDMYFDILNNIEENNNEKIKKAAK